MTDKVTNDRGVDETPSWLTRVQENSWEAEIILSGMVLFSLLKAPDALYNLRMFVAQELSGFNDLWYFEAAGRTAVQFLSWGFLLHLVMRGIWVGFVGLSYVFPQGIDPEKLKFQPRFNRRLPKAWLTPSVLRMETLCSMIFAFSFMLFLFALGLSFFYFCTNWMVPRIYSILHAPTFLRVGTQLFLRLGILVFFADFFTAGLIKRTPIISTAAYPFIVAMRYATLAFMYEKIYLTLIANVDRRKMAPVLIVLAALGYGSFGKNQDELFAFNHHLTVNAMAYDNLRPPHMRTERASIQADIIKDKTLRLFVAHIVNLEDAMAKHCDFDPSSSVRHSFRTRSPELQTCLSSFFIIDIDGTPQKNLTWRYHTRANGDQGYLTWIDITHQKPGSHLIKINLAEDPIYWQGEWFSIPYYREK